MEAMMDFGKAFSFVFEDQDWLKKIVIAALISLIPIIGQIYLLGYGMEVGRRVIRHEAQLLPDVAFGESLGLGFKSFVIGLVYSIPAIILSLPISLIPTVVYTSDSNTAASTSPLAVAVSLCCTGLLVLYGILVWVWLPAAEGNFLATGSIGAAFRFGEVFALLKAAPGAYLLVLLGLIIGGFIAPLGTIACFIGVLLTSTYVVVFTGHLYGQAYNAAIANKALM
jgi:hypothetical protein